MRADYRALWLELTARDPKDIARELLADTDRGALLRDTKPVFYVLSAAERDAVLARANERQNTTGPLRFMIMRRDKLDHVLRAAASVMGHDVFVLVVSAFFGDSTASPSRHQTGNRYDGERGEKHAGACCFHRRIDPLLSLPAAYDLVADRSFDHALEIEYNRGILVSSENE